MMAEIIYKKVKYALRSTENLYYRLVLLVGEAGSGKTRILQDVADTCNTSVINLNLMLARDLLELTPKQRSLRLPGILDQIVANTPASTPVVLDNLEILFDKNLMQDPLRLLQGISRNRAVVASWSGCFIDGKLTYAEPEHHEYRKYNAVDAMIVCMDGTATIDSKMNSEAWQA